MNDPTANLAPTADTEVPAGPTHIGSKIDRLPSAGRRYIEGVVDGMLENCGSGTAPPGVLRRELGGLTEEWERLAPVLETLAERTDKALALSDRLRGEAHERVYVDVPDDASRRQRIAAEDERFGRWLDDSGAQRLHDASYEVYARLESCIATL